MNKKTIIINGKPFTYNDELDDICYSTIGAISVEDARELILTTTDLFNRIGLDFYLAYGTLLGAIRDKGLIKGDEDVDVYVSDEKKLWNNLPFLYNNNFKLCRYEKGNLYSFKVSSNAYIDVYILRPCSISLWKPWCLQLSGMVTPKKYFRDEQTIDFLGLQCKCVKNPERLLAFWYGNTWQTPITIVR